MDSSLFKTALTYRAVIFDFDGVLAKIQVDWPALKNELRELITNETGECEELTPFDLQLNTILRPASARLIKKVNQTIESYELNGSSRHLIYPEILAMVRKLADSGVPLFICSSNTRKVIKNILQKTGTFACFRQIVSREDIHQRKPDPEGLLKIIAENDLNPKEVLFIGDRDVDRQAGSSAGIETRIIASGSRTHLAL
jgi:pyrophosphatase PpaX